MKSQHRIDQISQRLAAATKGKWSVNHELERIATLPSNDNGNRCDQIAASVYNGQAYVTHHKKDFELIAHAPDDIAWLINRVRRLEAALELVRDNAFSDMEGAGEPEFSNYDQTVGICGKALGEEE